MPCKRVRDRDGGVSNSTIFLAGLEPTLSRSFSSDLFEFWDINLPAVEDGLDEAVDEKFGVRIVEFELDEVDEEVDEETRFSS